MPLLRRKSSRIKVNFPLRFAHQVLQLDRLHYGLWDGEPLTREGLFSAQNRYTERLIEWIPDEVSSILDVGCGVGVDDLELSRRGYDVEGLSVDPYQERQYRERTGLPFHLANFSHFHPTRRYDLVLMSESCQYIRLEDVFSRFLAAAPGGYLLVADYFVVLPPDDGRRLSGHPLDRFLERAAEAGLTVERRQDVTGEALPTLELATLWLDRHVEPALEVGRDWMAYRHPALLALGRWFAGRRVRHALAEARRQVDPRRFVANRRYLFLLFRAPAGA